MLLRVVVDLLCHSLMHCLLVRIIKELDLFQNLKSRNGNVLKLINANGLLWCRIVKADQSRLIAKFCLSAIFMVGILLFVVDDHFKL